MSTAPRLPAEWEPQSAIMLTWPHDPRHWQEGIAGVERVFTEIASQVSAYQQVLIVCANVQHRQRIRAQLAGRGACLARIHLPIAPSNDCWARDHGPIGVYFNGARSTSNSELNSSLDHAPRLFNFRFNGWGGKYPYERDNAITARLTRAGIFGDTPVEPVDWVLEGGSIDCDGQGTALTTRACLLNETRNGIKSAAQVETALGRLLGLRRFLWLEHGYLAGDDTDGHIDMLARFIDPVTIAYMGCDDSDDANYTGLQGLATEAHALRRTDGRPYRLIELPSPTPIRDPQGGQLSASYANFLITNEQVLVPTYDQASDNLALARLQEYFPRREVIGIDCLPLIRQYGSLHCVTRQIPASIPIHD